MPDIDETREQLNWSDEDNERNGWIKLWHPQEPVEYAIPPDLHKLIPS